MNDETLDDHSQQAKQQVTESFEVKGKQVQNLESSQFYEDEFRHQRTKNDETLDDHSQQAKQQIMKSVERKGKQEQNLESSQLYEDEFRHQRTKNEDSLTEYTNQAIQQIVQQLTEQLVERKRKQEKDLGSSQSYEEEFRHQRFDSGHGIIIDGIFPKDFACDVVPWTSDERLKIMMDGVFPEGYRLETDIYYIKGSKAAGSLDRSPILTENITLKAMLQIRDVNVDYHYKGAVRLDNAWKFYEAQDKDITFRVDGVESFCVISILPEVKHTILSSGSQFNCPIDNRIQVKFPPNVVYKDEQISFKVHPFDMKCISERNKQDTENEVVCISAITRGLSSKHRKFNQTLEIQLPLHYPRGLQTIEDCEYRIFKWDDDGSFEFVDIEPVIQNNMVLFQANSFCGYGCVGSSKSSSISSLGSVVQEAYGLRMWCKILFFVGKKTNNNLPIMLECVDLPRVSEICKNRNKYGYHFVSEWISKDFFLIPDKTIITVDVKGKFGIPKECSVKHPKISFIPVSRDNFTRFPVELKSSGTVYGVLSIRDNKGVLDEIYYDPASTRHIPSNKKIRDELLGNRNDQLVKSKSSTTGIRNRKGGAKKSISNQKGGSADKKTEAEEKSGKVVNNTPNFFTEKGLLSLSEKMSPSTIFKVCLHMNMTLPEYETIQQTHGNTPMGNIKLFLTALDKQTQSQKLNLILEALTIAGQKELAEKLAELHSNEKPLHTI